MPRKKQSADKRNENGSTNLAIGEEIVSDGRNSNGNTNLQCSSCSKSICEEEIQCGKCQCFVTAPIMKYRMNFLNIF